MESTDVKIARMEGKLDNISDKVDMLAEVVNKHVESEDKKFNNLHKQFAPKWIEKIVWAVLLLMITGIGGAILKMIFV